MSATTIGITAQKGGQGKTITTLNLAAGLGGRGYDVLAVDLDSQGSLSHTLGVGRDERSPGMADVLLEGTPVGEAIRATEEERVDVVPCSWELAVYDVRAAREGWGTGRLRAALAPAREAYDVILVDTPPATGLLMTAVLAAIDGYLVPVQPQRLALEGLRGFLDHLARLRGRIEHPPRRLGIIPTMVDRRTRESREHLEDLENAFGDELTTPVPINVRISEAAGNRQSVLRYAPDATGAIAYRQIAQELENRIQIQDQP